MKAVAGNGRGCKPELPRGHPVTAASAGGFLLSGTLAGHMTVCLGCRSKRKHLPGQVVPPVCREPLWAEARLSEEWGDDTLQKKPAGSEGLGFTLLSSSLKRRPNACTSRGPCWVSVLGAWGRPRAARQCRWPSSTLPGHSSSCSSSSEPEGPWRTSSYHLLVRVFIWMRPWWRSWGKDTTKPCQWVRVRVRVKEGREAALHLVEGKGGRPHGHRRF